MFLSSCSAASETCETARTTGQRQSERGVEAEVYGTHWTPPPRGVPEVWAASSRTQDSATGLGRPPTAGSARAHAHGGRPEPGPQSSEAARSSALSP